MSHLKSLICIFHDINYIVIQYTAQGDGKVIEEISMSWQKDLKS